MSIKLISALWDLDVNGPDREVLSALCFYADDDGTNCYPGIALLKWKLGKSESQTQRILRRLESRGIIQVVERGNGRGNQSEYVLDLSKINLKENCPQKKVRIHDIKGSIQHQKDRIEDEKVSIQNTERVASSTGTEVADSKVFILPKKKDLGEKTDKSVSISGAREVFEFWRITLNHPGAKFTSDRERRIKSRFKDGYSVEDLKNAVLGCSLSPWHTGSNPECRVYDDLELICRGGKQVDQFIGIYRNPPLPDKSGSRASPPTEEIRYYVQPTMADVLNSVDVRERNRGLKP